MGTVIGSSKELHKRLGDGGDEGNDGCVVRKKQMLEAKENWEDAEEKRKKTGVGEWGLKLCKGETGSRLDV